MANSIALQPMRTTNGAGLFSKDTEGLIVGDYFPDPATRNALAGGVLDLSETLPMWGGIAISEGVTSDNMPQGGSITRATAIAGVTGFSVNINSAINSPGSEVPLSSANMQVNFFRIGSGQRVVVALDPALAGTLMAGFVNQDFAWDYTNQKIITGTEFKALGVRILSFSLNAKVPAYNTGTGLANWTVGPAAVIEL